MKLNFAKQFGIRALAQKHWYSNWPAVVLLAVCLIFVAVFWVIWITKLGPQAYFLYTPIFAERSSNLVFVLPTTATFIWFLNWFLYVFSYKKLKGAAYIFLATNFLAQVLILLVTMYYLFASR